MPIDNSALVAPFAPAEADGDTFIYTELLDRTKRKGNNGVRLARAFFHRSQAEFWEQWPTIVKLCDLSGCRAYTRLAPRSYKKVGREFVRLVVDTAMSENWAGMKSLYQRACGTVTPNEKLWLIDVDARDGNTERLAANLTEAGVLRARIPSRKGEHLIVVPFDARPWVGNHGWRAWGEVELHKDNPTNLYIPDEAA